MELLYSMPAPDSKLLDYWATLSSCLTDLDLSMDSVDKQLLHPAYLNVLTRLTRLAFGEANDSDSHEEEAHYAFELPELKVLCIYNLWAAALDLHCPQLISLRVDGCAIGKLCLQAYALEHLHNACSAPFFIHEGFPITNLIGLTYLSLDVASDIETEAVLFRGLPLMTRLRVLDLPMNTRLPAKLPDSLRDLTLVFCSDKAWDSLVIPLMQQLPGVESIRIWFSSGHPSFMGDKCIDHDLMPFLAMKSLKLLLLGKTYVWRASALRQLGELEAEVVRLGMRLELLY